MEIKALSKNEIEFYLNDLWNIVVEADKDFIPSLSSRESTTDVNLSVDDSTQCAKPVSYFNELKKQNFILALCENKVVGFISYISDITLDVEDYNPAEYLSTIVVMKSYRKSGVASGLYKTFLKVCQGKNAVTRTWSTNISHMNLLNKLGFVEIKRIENDRGAGIDTVYMGRKL